MISEIFRKGAQAEKILHGRGKQYFATGKNMLCAWVRTLHGRRSFIHGFSLKKSSRKRKNFLIM